MKRLTAATITALVLAGCSTPAHDQATPQPDTPTPGTTATATTQTTTGAPLSPRGQVAPWTATADPDTVASDFARASWTFDTATDTSPLDAQHRAAGFAAPLLAGQLTSGGPSAGGGAQWAQLLARHGWTTATASTIALPMDAPDTETTKTRQVTITVTAHGDNGWSSSTLYPPQVMFVQLAAAQGGWHVNTFRAAPQQ